MTEPRNRSETDPSVAAEDRRAIPRCYARAHATVIRESDRVRTGLPAKLYDLTIIGVGLRMKVPPPDLQEVIKVELENTVQRVKIDVRGIVKHVTPMPDGSWRVGVELLTRLTPLQVSLMKMTRIAESGEFPVWV